MPLAMLRNSIYKKTSAYHRCSGEVVLVTSSIVDSHVATQKIRRK